MMWATIQARMASCWVKALAAAEQQFLTFCLTQLDTMSKAEVTLPLHVVFLDPSIMVTEAGLQPWKSY